MPLFFWFIYNYNWIMRYLGIDYGKKRIGLALSDESGKLAFPLIQLTTYKQLTTKNLKRIIRENRVGVVVVGLPITFGGGESQQTKEVRVVGQKIENELKLKVEYENEILTTKMAEKSGVPKNKLDAVSAAIILQSYLDKQKWILKP